MKRKIYEILYEFLTSWQGALVMSVIMAVLGAVSGRNPEGKLASSACFVMSVLWIYITVEDYNDRHH